MRILAGCALAFVAASIVTVAPTSERVEAAPIASCGGVVFFDGDADGNRREALGRDGVPDDLEAGLPDVEVTITDRTGRIETTRTGADGTWRTTTTRYPIRVDVTPPDGLHDSVSGPTSATTRQFIAESGDCGGPIGSVGLVDPQRYCAADAPVVAVCHQRSDADDLLPTHPTVKLVAASTRDDRSTDAVADDDWLTGPTEQLASVGSIGTVYGLAAAPDGRIFASAFVKRHTELRSELNPTGNPTAIFELGVDERPRLLTILDETADDPHRPGGRDPADDDAAVMDDVFRAGIGDIELSLDGRRLYAVDLGRRALVSVDPDDGNILETTPLDGIRLGVAGCAVTAADPYGSLRPFGLGTGPDGELLIGVVCSAESTVEGDLPIDDTVRVEGGAGDESQLVGYVYEYTGGRFLRRLEWPLAGHRGETSEIDMLAHRAAWHPWVDVYPFVADHKVASYPQPAITDISVDPDGNLLLALGDRWSHQTAPHSTAPATDGAREIDEIIAAGDLQRACPSANGWVIEGSPDCAGGIGDGWEFFSGDRYGYHAETPLGSIAIAPGHHDAVATQFDPLPDDGTWQSGGLVWHDTVTGEFVDGLRLYDGRNARPAGTFEQSSGLGDVELLCGEVPIVFGGRIWHDDNGDGAADPIERPIAGVPLELLDPNGRTIATTETDASGRYEFDARDVERGLDAGKKYTVVMSDDAHRSGPFGPDGAWSGLRPSTPDHLLSGRVEFTVIGGDDPLTPRTEGAIRQDIDIAMTDQYDLALDAAVARRDVESDVLGLDVIIVNQGSRHSGGFTVTSRIPPGSRLVEAGNSRYPARIDGDLVTWVVDAADELPPGRAVHLPIRIEVARHGDTEYVYAAQLVAHDGDDDDSTPGNALLDHPATLQPLVGSDLPADRFGIAGWEDDSGTLRVRLSTIAGTVWFDEDRDATRDIDASTAEPTAAGVELVLLDDRGSEFVRTTTDEDGWFEFPLLDSGTYRVAVPAANFRSGGALDGMNVIVRPDGSLADGFSSYRSEPIELPADRTAPVLVTNIGVAHREPAGLLGGAGPLLVGPGVALGTYGLLRRQRRRNRFGTGDLGRP